MNDLEALRHKIQSLLSQDVEYTKQAISLLGELPLSKTDRLAVLGLERLDTMADVYTYLTQQRYSGNVYNILLLWLSYELFSSRPEAVEMVVRLKEHFPVVPEDLPLEIEEMLSQFSIRSGRVHFWVQVTGADAITAWQQGQIFHAQPEKLSQIQELSFSLHSVEQLLLLPNLRTLSIHWSPTIETALEQLKSLRCLDIIGSVPAVPHWIGGLSSLEVLKIFRADVASIPESIGALQNLRILNLSYNNLQQLPMSIGQLQNLEELSIAGNPILIDGLPKELGQLPKLRKLFVLFSGLDDKKVLQKKLNNSNIELVGHYK